MKNIEYIKHLPKVEVSFQDDFAGNEREFALTPDYILRQLHKQGVMAEVGNKVCLWEKDIDTENKISYLCEVAEISEVDNSYILNRTNLSIEKNKFASIKNRPILIKIIEGSGLELTEEEWLQVI